MYFFFFFFTGFFSFVFLQKCFFFLFLLHLFLCSRTLFFCRLCDKCSCKRIQDSGHSIFQFIQIHFCSDHCRNIHHSRKNCRMGIGRAMYSYKSKNFLLIQLHGLTRRKIICNNNRCFLSCFHSYAVSI